MAPHQILPRRLRPVIPWVLVALLTLTACGGAGSPTTPAAPEGTFPATVTHEYGRTVVQEEPERVVALGATDQDPLLALGAVPVAVRELSGARPSATWPWATDRFKGAQPQVLPAGDVTPDAVAALKPDLIVAISAGLTREQYDAYSRVAPTVAGPQGAADGLVSWQDATRLSGAALGLPGEADRLIRQVEDQFLEAEEQRPELAGATVAAVRPNPADAGSFMAWSSQDLRVQFLKDLGMQLPTEVDRLAGDRSYATLPAGELRTLDRADALVVVGTEAERTAFTALPGYGQMELVQQSKIVNLDDDQSAALSVGSVLSLPWVLDELTGRIARAVQR
jgi:iron complex transport system substrate-binding protein